MKKILLSLLASACAGGFVYLLGAFGAAGFDIREWDITGRSLVACFGGLFMVLVFLIIYVELLKEPHE